MKSPPSSAILCLLAGFVGSTVALTCKCIPGDECWPSVTDWATLNASVSGKLIVNTPMAASCYPGSSFDPTTCATVQANWLSTAYRSQFPIGYSYTDSEPCDIPGGNTSSCLLGNSPIYAVNATTPSDVAAAVVFAKQKNIRLVTKATGHDFLYRSTGFGSLEVWLRYIRPPITVEQQYSATQPCVGINGTGPAAVSAIDIGAGYSWSDVHPIARANNLIVVGSSCSDVSAIGGYMQGGGHSPATSMFGLAADQLLEANMILSDGSYVLTSACVNPDLFTALRGGGGGTYGIIISAKVRAYPEVQSTSIVMTMSPAVVYDANDVSLFLQSIAYLYQYCPFLADAGLGGYLSWTIYGPTNIFGGSGPSLYMNLIGINQNVTAVQNLFNPVINSLVQMNNSNINISAWYTPFSAYGDYYANLSGTNTPPAGGIAVSSRLLSRAHLTDTAALRYMLNMTAGQPDEQTIGSAAIVGGPGLLQAFDAQSGVNPAWRRASLLHIITRGWPANSTSAHVEDVHHDMTNVKGAAAAALAPDSGAYMNEADWQDPNYQKDFYGDALPAHQAAKAKYDPDGVFYCPTCVGAEQWVTDGAGRICRP